MSFSVRTALVASLIVAGATSSRADTLHLEGSWQSTLGPWHGGIKMTIKKLTGSRLSGISESTNGLCVGPHPIDGSLKSGRWVLVTRPGGMCRELHIELIRNGDAWNGTYALVGPTPDKGTNTLQVVR